MAESVFESVIAQERTGGIGIAGVRTLIRSVCDAAGSKELINDARVELASAGVIEAIQARNNFVIFDWLFSVMSYQGISDVAARRFTEEHGEVKAKHIAAGLAPTPACGKLKGYHAFYECGFRKGQWTCRRPELFDACPLPRHDLRNGVLNQMAHSLFFFMRDVAMGDFVGWVDALLRRSGTNSFAGLPNVMMDPFSAQLAHIYGVGPKVARLAMTTLLLGGDAERKDWIVAGGAMVVVDSLVHNWMHRTGMLRALGKDHSYGDACYGSDGCAVLIERLSRLVDAKAYNSDYPKHFPRFVQYAIWTFCSFDGLNICNGNQIDDFKRCRRRDCDLYVPCARRRLHRRTTRTFERRS